MPPFLRNSQFGFPLPGAPSAQSEMGFLPLGGFQPNIPELDAQPGSLLSAQNVWVHNTVLQPRWKLSASSFSNPMFSSFGNTTNPNSAGTKILGASSFGAVPVSILSNTFAFAAAHAGASAVSWSLASMVATTEPDILPAITGAFAGGVITYSSPANTQLYVFGGSGSSVYSWTGVLSPPVFSRVTGSPRMTDVAAFQNRVVTWHYLTPANRVSWCIAGDPTDWTGIGSGYEDLADMVGLATRIFATEDELILATEQELWRGRHVGLPYIFHFSPITRTLGIPHSRAAIKTPLGIFWLGFGKMIYRLAGETVEPFGAAVQEYLRERLQQPEWAFFTYSGFLQQLRLFYCTTATSFPTTSLTYDFTSQRWSEEVYGHAIQAGAYISMEQLAASAFTYNPPNNEFLYTSAGTVGLFMKSMTSDLGVSVEEDAVLAPITGGAVTRRHFLQEARYDFAAESASSATVSWSTDFGRTTGVSQRLAISASSNASQLLTYPSFAGQYLTPRIQSTNGSWQLRRVYAKTKDSGKAV